MPSSMLAMEWRGRSHLFAMQITIGPSPCQLHAARQASGSCHQAVDMLPNIGRLIHMSLWALSLFALPAIPQGRGRPSTDERALDRPPAATVNRWRTCWRGPGAAPPVLELRGFPARDQAKNGVSRLLHLRWLRRLAMGESCSAREPLTRISASCSGEHHHQRVQSRARAASARIPRISPPGNPRSRAFRSRSILSP